MQRQHSVKLGRVIGRVLVAVHEQPLRFQDAINFPQDTAARYDRSKLCSAMTEATMSRQPSPTDCKYASASRCTNSEFVLFYFIAQALFGLRQHLGLVVYRDERCPAGRTETWLSRTAAADFQHVQAGRWYSRGIGANCIDKLFVNCGQMRDAPHDEFVVRADLSLKAPFAFIHLFFRCRRLVVLLPLLHNPIDTNTQEHHIGEDTDDPEGAHVISAGHGVNT